MLQRSQTSWSEPARSLVPARPEPQLCGEVLERLDTPVFLFGCGPERHGLIYANRAFERWAGCAGAALEGMDWPALCCIRPDDPGLAHLQSCVLGGRGGRAVVRAQPSGRTPRWAQVQVSPLPDAQGRQRFIGQLRDVTAEARERAQLRRQALYDGLTGLPNRRLLQIRLQQAIVRARTQHLPFALVFLDLDRFKAINDSLGHEAADQLLRRIAERLRHGIRAHDTVARLYGDEFALLLSPLPDEPSAELICSRVAAWLHQPFVVNGMRLTVSCSVGVALYPDGTDGHHLLASADRDMYRHKQTHQRRTSVDCA